MGHKGDSLHVSVLNFSPLVHHRETQSPCFLAQGFRYLWSLQIGSLQSCIYSVTPRLLMLLGQKLREKVTLQCRPNARGLRACYRTAEIPQPSVTKEVTAASPAFSPGRGSAGKMGIEKLD